MKEFNSIDEISEDTYFIFKHSVTCPISAGANDVVNSVESELEIPIYLIIVQKSRELSDNIAKHFRIGHESPQLLLIKDGRVVWDKSHYSIRAKEIRNAVDNL